MSGEAIDWTRSGLTKKDWCEIHGMAPSTLKYHIKVLKNHAAKQNQTVFEELPAPKSNGMPGAAMIENDASASES